MKRLSLYPLFIFSLILTETAISQTPMGCKRLVEWNDAILKEFPDIDFYRTANRNREAYDLMLYNMYSDKIFAPIFGKSFSEMSGFRRNRIYKQIRGCKSNYNIAKKTEQATTILGSLSGAKSGKYSQENVAIKASEINSLRKEYESVLNRLSGNADVTIEEIESYKNKLTGDFKTLLPSEREKLEQFIKNKEENAAFIKLKSIAQIQIEKPNSYQSLLQLASFRDDNRSLFDLLSNSQKGEINDIIRNKSNEILAELLPSENNKIKAIKNTNSPLTEFNALYDDFDKRYDKFVDYPIVQESYHLIVSEKTEFISNQRDDLIKKIKEAQSISEIESLKSVYLSHTLSSDPTITQLTSLSNQKVSEIKEAERQRMIAERKEEKRRLELQERERQLAEARALERYGFSFNTDGLRNEELVNDFFKGNFIDIPFNRDDLLFAGMIRNYMYAYAESCASSLPSNKVQIFKDVCSRESVKTNGWGVEISRYCIEWTEVGTGLYSNPDLYHAYKTVKSITNKDGVKNTWKLLMQMTRENSVRPLNEMALDHESIQLDMIKVIQLNGCKNKALKRFENNLIQVANNKTPIKLDGTVKSVKVDYSKKQDLVKLTKDLVYENSKSWTFKYVKNSVNNVRVISRDNQNRPKKITANYLFEGVFGRQRDEVQITFKNGLPDCIYFLNYSTNCRTPDRTVVSNFVNNKYGIK